MADSKLISIDEFTSQERLLIDSKFRYLVDKYQQRNGRFPDSKKQRELMAEARQQVMSERKMVQELREARTTHRLKHNPESRERG